MAQNQSVTSQSFNTQIPARRTVGVLLSVARDGTGTADDAIYDLDVVRERVARGQTSEVSRKNHTVGYITGIGNIEGTAAEAAGHEVITPLFSPPHISLVLTAVGLERENLVKKCGVLHPGQDINGKPVPLYLVAGIIPGSIHVDPDPAKFFLFHLRNPALLTDRANWSIESSPPFTTTLALTALIIPRFVDKRLRSTSLSDTFERRKLPRTVLPPPDLPPGSWVGPLSALQADHLGGSSGLQGEGIGYEWGGGISGGSSGLQGRMGWGGSGSLHSRTEWAGGSAGSVQHLPGGSGGFQGEMGRAGGSAYSIPHLAGGNTGLHGGVGWAGGSADGMSRGSGGLQGGMGWASSSAGGIPRLPGASGSLQGGMGWGGGSADSTQRLPGGSGVFQGGMGGGSAEVNQSLADDADQRLAQWLMDEFSQEEVGLGGETLTGNESLDFGGEDFGDEGFGVEGFGVGGEGFGAEGSGDDDSEDGDFGSEDGDFEDSDDDDSDSEDSDSSDEDSGNEGFDEERPISTPSKEPRQPPIAERNNVDYDATQIALYIVLLYRRQLIERGKKLNKLICPLRKIRVKVSELWGICFKEIRVNPNRFSADVRKEIEDVASRAILRRISHMKGFATAVVYGPEERGGYGITNTPEGIQKAKDLLTNDRYLYHPVSGVKYAHTSIVQVSQRMIRGKVSGHQHPHGVNDENIPEFFSMPELEEMRSDTADHAACDLIFERLQLIVGNPGIAKARPNSRWNNRRVDYRQHAHLLPPSKKIDLKDMCVRVRAKAA